MLGVHGPRPQLHAAARQASLRTDVASSLKYWAPFEFDHPNQEPLLRVPDAVAGAVAAALAPGEARYLEAFGRSVDACSCLGLGLKSPELRESREPAIPREVPASLAKA